MTLLQPRHRSAVIFIACLAVFTIAVTIAAHFGLVSTSFVKTLGKTLCLCLAALAMDLIWGYAGILSLGHMAFFALGGYMIGMWLMYARTEEIVVASLANGGLPATPEEISQGIATQIFGVVGASDLPAIWSLAYSLPLQLALVVLVPGLLALIFGWLAFRSRVTGVYLSILTQAMTLALALYLFQNDSGLRGNNGLSGLQNLPGVTAGQDAVSLWFFWASAAALAVAYLVLHAIISGKFGSVIRAIRDDEARVRFLGYSVEGYKLFVFTLTAVICALAGALYYPQAGIINPAELAPIASIYLAVWVAIGGRGRLYGAVIGAALVSLLSSWFTGGRVPSVNLGVYTINWVDWWLVLLGLTFVCVTLFAPKGLGGLVDRFAGVHAPDRKGAPLGPDQGSLQEQEAQGMSALLEVSGVTVSFDGFRAINNLTFAIGSAELRAIIGPNGAGKSTFMDIVTGKTRPDSGSVTFGDRSVSLLKLSEAQIARAGIGRKFQRPTVFEDQTVHENLTLALKAARSPWAVLAWRKSARDEDRIRSLATQVGLGDSLGRKAGILSHGQKQWLEIAMLLAQEPKLLLVDEPAAGMTLAEREKTTELLVDIAKTRAVVVVEHDMDFVRRLDCKVTVLHEGAVLAEGSLDHVTKNQAVIDVYLGRG